MRSGVIYFLLDPKAHEVRYVGQTVQAPGKRLIGHVSDARAGKKRYVCYWIRSLLPDKPVMQVVETLPEDQLDAAEQYWIQFMRSENAALCNLADGGAGARGFRHTDEALQKMAAAARRRSESEQWILNVRAAARVRKGGNNRTGISHSPETRAKMSAVQAGRQPSAETRAKMSAAAKARARTAEGRAHLSSAGAAGSAARKRSGNGQHRRANQNTAKTHCIKGHEFTPENTYIRPSGARDCRICSAERKVRYKLRQIQRKLNAA